MNEHWWQMSEKLQKLIFGFGRVCDRKLRVNVNKARLFRLSSGERQVTCSVSLNGENLEEM